MTAPVMPSGALEKIAATDKDAYRPEPAGNYPEYQDEYQDIDPKDNNDEAAIADTPGQCVSGYPDRILAKFGITAGGPFIHDRKLVWNVLRDHQRFGWYFGGSLVSNFGTWLQTTAQILLAYHMTRSVFDLGVLTSAQFLFPLAIGSWAGAIANWFGSKRTLVWSQTLSAAVAAVLAGLVWSGGLTETWLIAGALLTGLFTTFSLPAQSAIAGALVLPDGDGKNGSTDTVAAMAMNSVSYNAGRALAPVFSILTVMLIGFGWAFALNAVSFAAFLAILRRVKCTPADRTVACPAGLPDRAGQAQDHDAAADGRIHYAGRRPSTGAGARAGAARVQRFRQLVRLLQLRARLRERTRLTAAQTIGVGTAGGNSPCHSGRIHDRFRLHAVDRVVAPHGVRRRRSLPGDQFHPAGAALRVGRQEDRGPGDGVLDGRMGGQQADCLDHRRVAAQPRRYPDDRSIDGASHLSPSTHTPLWFRKAGRVVHQIAAASQGAGTASLSPAGMVASHRSSLARR